ncbi:MAG: DNA-binding response regulator [Verrucomicrobia bacterium GWF2_62_7]|nr:MAG: DNA-binding response regulator [Verrucomicrobia bacterium GWF2_62_7]
MKTRVLLADDHKIMREGLRSLLAVTPGVEVVGEAGDGRTAVQLVLKLMPDVVVMDIGMPDLNGVDATRQIKTRAPRTKVIALSLHSDERFIAGMFKAGASGYLLKDGAFEELAHAIRTVAAGHTYLCPRIAKTVVKDYLRDAQTAASSGGHALSDREREVLQLVAEGRSTKEIAGLLDVSVKTIETHRTRIMERLGVHSVAELTKYAVRAGLTSLET